MTTIRDVAKYAGVSPITVSRVVNESENVNAETRAKVEKAIEDLGYIPNLAARSLRSKQTFTLALILPDITSGFWTTVARGVEDAAQGGSYSVFLCNTDENPEKFTKYLNTVIRQRVDGVIVAPYSMNGQQLSQLSEMKIPTVVIDRRLNHWDGDMVYCDSIAGAQALTQHLLSLGHKRIAIISGPSATSTAEDRVAGYCLALHKAGIPIDERLILRGEYRESSGILLTRELIRNSLKTTAVIAANNTIAAGVLDELKRHDIRVPEDMAVVAFDEMPEMERRFPFMTNVTQPAYDMGVNATQLMLSRINASGILKSREVILPTRLILRYSCGRFLKSDQASSKILYSLIPDITESQLIKPLDDADRELLLTIAPHVPGTSQQDELKSGFAKPIKERLSRALQGKMSDRLPIMANQALNRAFIEQCIGHPVRLASDGLNILPEDAVEFALKLGLDALPCEISWQLGAIDDDLSTDLSARVRQAYPAPSLAAQIGVLEDLLTAVENSGIGVYVRFNSFVENALRIVSECDLGSARKRHPDLDKLMDMLVKHHCRVMRALCDRFGRDLLFISIDDDALTRPDLVDDLNLFENSVLPRLASMIIPAREHGLPIALNCKSFSNNLLSRLLEIGINVIHLPSLDVKTLSKTHFESGIAQEWSGKMAFIGGISLDYVADLSTEEIDGHVDQALAALSNQPRFIIGVDAGYGTGITGKNDFPIRNFTTMVRAIQKYGSVKA